MSLAGYQNPGNPNRSDVLVIGSAGVLTFYSNQRKMISDMMRGPHRPYRNLNLYFGTVDFFQGDERDLIIVSMVRSNDRFSLGFTDCFKRMNVAMTRAKSGFVVVGDGRMMTSSPWLPLMPTSVQLPVPL